MRIAQKDIANLVGLSGAHLSNILSGKVEVGKPVSKLMGAFCDRPWTDFLTMEPAEIRRVLFEAAEKSEAN